MEPFVIQCTTCRARLKVTDPALVGDIVGCPKCESFVQVTPPPGWQAPAVSPAVAPPVSPAVAPPAATSGAPRALAEAAPRAVTDTQTPGDTVRLERKPAPGNSSIQRSAPRAAAAAAAAPPPLPGGSAPAAPVGAAPAGALAAGGKRVAAAATGPASLIVPEPAGEPGLAAHWLAAVRQHYWISLGGALSAALLIAVAWLALRPRSEAPATADADGAPVAQQSETAGELADADATGPDAPSRVDELSNASTDPDAAAAATSDGAAPPAENPAPQTAATEPADTPTPSVEKAGPAEAAPADEAPAKSPQTGPLDTIARALAAEPEPLTSTDPSAAGSTGGPRPAGRSTAAEDESGEQFDGVKQARLVAHLQDKIPPLEFRDVPLNQFVAFLSELSTVPIAIDEQSLSQAGKPSRQKISVKLSSGTVESALRAALNKPGLTFHVGPKQILITAPAPKP